MLAPVAGQVWAAPQLEPQSLTAPGAASPPQLLLQEPQQSSLTAPMLEVESVDSQPIITVMQAAAARVRMLFIGNLLGILEVGVSTGSNLPPAETGGQP